MKFLTKSPRFVLMLTVAVLLTAGVMRAPLVVYGTLVQRIGEALNLSTTALGGVGTLSVFCFGAVTLLATPLLHRFGLLRTMMLATVCIAVGMIIRSIGTTTSLYVGTAIFAGAIAVCNVLMPVLIKRFYPEKVSTMMGVYSAVMGLSCGIIAMVAVPLAKVSGWQFSLGIWAVFAILGATIWFAIRKSDSASSYGEKPIDTEKNISLLRSSLAWQVSIFMGLQSLLYYTFATWLPSMLMTRGFSDVVAGNYTSLSQWVALPSSLVIGRMLKNPKKHARLAYMSGAMAVVGMLGLAYFPDSLVWLAISLNMFSNSLMFVLCLLFFNARTSNSKDAARLSAMAQCFGYFIASIGPWVASQIFEISGSWNGTFWLLAVLMAMNAWCGAMASRERVIR